MAGSLPILAGYLTGDYISAGVGFFDATGDLRFHSSPHGLLSIDLPPVFTVLQTYSTPPSSSTRPRPSFGHSGPGVGVVRSQQAA